MDTSTTAADPLRGAGFNAIYARDIEPELKRLEIERQKAMRLSRLIWIATGLLTVGYVAYSAIRGGFDGAFGSLTWVFFGGSVGAGLGFLPLHVVGTKTKTAIIGALCRPMGIEYTPETLQPPGFDGFKALSLLPSHTDKAFQDQFVGSHAGAQFCLYEAKLSSGSGKDRKVVFSGQLLRVGFPQRFLGTTVVLRQAAVSLFDRPKGLEKVGLEDPRFEKTFEVFGDDQVEARAILTPAFMQRLMHLERAYDGENLRCAFTEGDLLLAIEGPNRFEIGDIFSSLVERGRVQAIAADIHELFALIDDFTAKAEAA